LDASFTAAGGDAFAVFGDGIDFKGFPPLEDGRLPELPIFFFTMVKICVETVDVL
jgi:hypothetical protein